MATTTETTFDEDGNVIAERTIDVPDVPPSDAERLVTLEAKLAAVEALATKADATAQEVAKASRDATAR